MNMRETKMTMNIGWWTNIACGIIRHTTYSVSESRAVLAKHLRETRHNLTPSMRYRVRALLAMVRDAKVGA